MHNKILSTLLALSFITFTAQAKADPLPIKNNHPTRMEIDIQSKRVPAGTKIQIRIVDVINTKSTKVADIFDATIVHDIKVGGDIILPSGTALRGTINDINKATILSRGANVLLSFDHVVTPVGKQVPIHAVITNYDNLTYLGAITSGSSYGGEVKEGLAKGKNITVSATKWGLSTGRSFWKGYPVYVTTPISAGVGAIGGCGYFAGKSIISLFAKGDDVFIEKGKIFDIRLTQPLDIPVN